MTDTAEPMVATSTIDTTQPPYYFPTRDHPDSHVLRELTLYASRRLGEICFVRIKGESLEPPAIFEIHAGVREYDYIGEIVKPVETTTGWMGTTAPGYLYSTGENAAKMLR